MADGELETYPPCVPDCENDLFTPPYPAPAYSFTVALSCGKTVEVYYRTRIACGLWQDLYIEYIEFHQLGNGWNNASACGQWLSIHDILKETTEQLLLANPMGFSPNGQDGCERNWRVMKGACWQANFQTRTHVAGLKAEKNLKENLVSKNKESQIQSPSIGHLFAFSTEECCLQSYRVCINNGVKTVTLLSEMTEMPECPQFCEPVCEDDR